MNRKLFAMICLLLLTTYALAVYASSTEPSNAEKRISWTSDKITRGLTNITTGWLEIPNKIDNCVKKKGILEGTISGAVKGLGWGLYRTGSGVFDLITSPLSMIKPDKKPIIDPPTLFEK